MATSTKMSLLQPQALSFKEMQELNTLKNNPKKLSTVLQKSFSNAPCPFDHALKMLRGITAKNRKKPKSLCDYIVEALKKWIQEHPECDIPMPVKSQIVPLSCDFTMANSKALLLLFQVDQPDLEMVRTYIYQYYQTREYNKMVYIITMLKLQCPAYTEQLIIPILVQGESVLTEHYMKGSIGAQKNLLLVVDGWLRNFQHQYFSNVSATFIEQKSLVKLLARWQEMFPHTDTPLPNLRRQKAFDQIRYYLQRFYREKSMSARALEDLVHKYINNDPGLARTVSRTLHGKFRDQRRSRKLLQRYCRGHNQGDDTTDIWSDCEDDPDVDDYLPLKVDFDHVLMVDSVEKLVACGQDLHDMTATSDESCKLVGFDAEFADDTVALLQLAVADKVFLVDLFTLRQLKHTNELSAFLARLLTSKRLLILGFGVGSDLKLLRREFKDAIPAQPANLLDVFNLRDAHPRYKLLPEKVAVDHRGKKLTGLSRIVCQTLGKPLDKREQISNWERRPLRLKQATYAAMDAYCLLQVYEVLDKRLTESGVKLVNKTLLSISRETPTGGNVSNKKQKKEQKTTTKAAPSIKQGSSISVRDFRVICDTMLGGLCKMLRNLGIDATERDANTTIQAFAKLAKAEGRHILTSDAPSYDLLCMINSAEMCTKLEENAESHVQALLLVNKFKVQIGDENLFSRCQLCNRDRFFILMGHDMKRVHRRKMALESGEEHVVCDEIVETMMCGEGEGKSADVTSHLRMNDLVLVSLTDDNQKMEVALKFDSPMPAMDRLFFCCSGCGKIYWKGGHLSKTRQTFASALVNSK